MEAAIAGPRWDTSYVHHSTESIILYAGRANYLRLLVNDKEPIEWSLKNKELAQVVWPVVLKHVRARQYLHARAILIDTIRACEESCGIVTPSQVEEIMSQLELDLWFKDFQV